MATITKPPQPEATKEPIETARIEIKPPQFVAAEKVQLTPEQELEKALSIIEDAKNNQQSSVKIAGDLSDYTWQKLSQKGYKIQRRVLPRLVQTNVNADELDQNRIEFEINLKEFNRTDI